MALPAQRRRRSLSRGSARSIQMVLLIEYVLDYPDGVPQRAIVAAMHTLGYTPEATRQALSRAVRAGALIQSGRGTNAHIKLSDDARGPLVEARTRLERGPGAPEAEEWLILIVRARDTEGTTAYSRRTTLLLNGLGSLGGGVWIRPKTGPFDEIVAMVNEDPAVATVAMTARIDHPTMGEVAAQAWDISAIATGYDELLADFADREAAGPEEQFRAWTEFVDSWQRVGKLDPELPTAALGSGSSRPAALMLVERLRTSWRPAAQAYFRSLVD